MAKYHENWKNEVCGNCYFFQNVKDYHLNVSICRRFPPDHKCRTSRVQLRQRACSEFVEVFERRVEI
jgi:hypothetical protein